MFATRLSYPLKSTSRVCLAWALLAGPLVFSSCKDRPPDPRGAYEGGVFIVNEGAFGAGNGEISFYDRTTRAVTNGVFGKENIARPLGDVVQSMLIHRDKGYVVVNNSNKVEVVNAFTMKNEATIALRQPRYAVAEGDFVYVSEWVDNNFTTPVKGRVSVINATTNAVETTISTDGSFPGQLTVRNGRLYVANSGENTVAIINLQTRQLEGKVTVGNGPRGLVADRNGDLWVLCNDYTNPSRLVRLTPSGSTLTVRATLSFLAAGGGNLAINATGDRLYYTYGPGFLGNPVYGLDITATALPNAPLLNRTCYGIGLDPRENVLFVGVATSFTNPGRVVRYDLTTRAPLDSATVGVGPNGFVFQ